MRVDAKALALLREEASGQPPGSGRPSLLLSPAQREALAPNALWEKTHTGQRPPGPCTARDMGNHFWCLPTGPT